MEITITITIRSSQVGTDSVKSGLFKSSQDMSNQFGSSQIKSRRVKSSYDRYFFGTKTVLDPTLFWTLNLFGPKMNLRMEFNSDVGPTCHRSSPPMFPFKSPNISADQVSRVVTHLPSNGQPLSPGWLPIKGVLERIWHCFGKLSVTFFYW